MINHQLKTSRCLFLASLRSIKVPFHKSYFRFLYYNSPEVCARPRTGVWVWSWWGAPRTQRIWQPIRAQYCIVWTNQVPVLQHLSQSALSITRCGGGSASSCCWSGWSRTAGSPANQSDVSIAMSGPIRGQYYRHHHVALGCPRPRDLDVELRVHRRRLCNKECDEE